MGSDIEKKIRIDKPFEKPFGGKNSVFNNPLSRQTPKGYGIDADLAKREEKKMVAGFKKDLITAQEEGSLSNRTAAEILQQLETTGAGNISDLRSMFTKEVEGTSASGRSRLATQKLFETLADQPGRKQTLLTPRSNTSRGILGV